VNVNPQTSPCHAAEEMLMLYSMGDLPDDAVPALEEHLLVCAHCQSGLAAIDDHIRVAVTAAQEIRELEPASTLGDGLAEPAH